MSSALINLRSGSAASSAYFNLLASNDTPIEIPGTPFTVSYRVLPSMSSGTLGTTTPPSGEAGWVGDETNAYRTGHASSDSATWVEIELQTPSNVRVRGFSNQGSGRVTDWQVNAEPIQKLSGENSTEIVDFTAAPDANGVVLIKYKRADESSGMSYANVVLVEEIAGPELSIDQSEINPGTTVTGSGSNYAGIPADQSSATVSDGTNSITVPVTITNANAGEGTFDFSFTMPSRPATDGIGVPGIRYSQSATVTIPDPGA